MKRMNLVALTVAAATAASLTGAATASASDHDVRLANSAAAPSGLRQIGDLPGATSMQLTLQLPLRNQALMNSMIARGQVISPAQYNQLFGVSQAQINAVVKWAKSQGMAVTDSSTSGAYVAVSTNASKVNKSFKVTMKKANRAGASGYAPSAAPAVPSALGVSAVVGLDNMTRAHAKPPTKPQGLATPGSSSGVMRSNLARNRGASMPVTNAANNCSQYWGQNLFVSGAGKRYTNMSNMLCDGYSPQKIVQMYGVSGAANVKPTLGILLWGNDTAAYNNANNLAGKYGYPKMIAGQYQPVVNPANSNMSQCENGHGEQNLDVQATHAIAPKATIRYYGAASCTWADLSTMLLKAVGEHRVSTLSMSFGAKESSGITSIDQTWTRALNQASLTGISVFASTGDWGSDGRTVEMPASYPNITAVGGTSVGLNSSGGRAMTAGWENKFYAQPSATSQSGSTDITLAYGQGRYSGAGGGNSVKFPLPAWQKGVVTGTKRALPDVSALADPYVGMTVLSDGQYLPYGGTSLASPLVAAMVGASKAMTGRKIGNAAPALYKLRGTSAIRDVTHISAGMVAGQFSSGTYANQLLIVGMDANPENFLVAKSGWDNVTGIGEPNGSAFLSGLGK